MTEWVSFRTFIMWLDDNDLLTGVTTSDNDSYLKKNDITENNNNIIIDYKYLFVSIIVHL